MSILQIFVGGGILTVMGSIVGMVVQHFLDKQNKIPELEKEINGLKKEMAEQKEENCLLCYGISACLDGLQQLGANHIVPVAKDKLEKHLNKKAHDLED